MGFFGKSTKQVVPRGAVSKRTGAASPGARSQAESDRDAGRGGKKKPGRRK